MADGLKLSEIFESLQGEGLNAGKPCLFVRLALCNLHCRWCDTKYTWDFDQFDYETEVQTRSVTDVAQRISASPMRHAVITGGEPLLQQSALIELCASIAADIYLEVETNGTIAPRAELLARIDQWNVSPKLTHAGDPAPLRLRPSILRRFAGVERAYLKLVIQTPTDSDEASALVRDLGWHPQRVFFMPQASNREDLRARTPDIARASLALGYRFSSRLHLELWDGRRGT